MILELIIRPGRLIAYKIQTDIKGQMTLTVHPFHAVGSMCCRAYTSHPKEAYTVKMKGEWRVAA